MSFEDWAKNGWLDTHQSSREEIGNLLGIVERDLKDSQSKDVSNDWRFAIAYNAALQAATAALDAAGSLDRHRQHGAQQDSRIAGERTQGWLSRGLACTSGLHGYLR